MQITKALVLAATTLSSALFLPYAGVSADVIVSERADLAPLEDPSFSDEWTKRNSDIPHIVSIIKHHKKKGSDFCSSYLHLPKYAATTTVTTTEFSTKTVTSAAKSTTTKLRAAAKSTITSVSTPTLKRLFLPPGAGDEPHRSTTAHHPHHHHHHHHHHHDVEEPPHNPHRTRLPYWLNQYPCPEVSKACSKVVVPKTKTVHTTFIATHTVVPTASPTPGRIRLNKVDDGSFYGYVSSDKTSDGAAYVVQDTSDALTVSLPGNIPTSGGPLNLAVSDTYPYLGACDQYDSDLQAGWSSFLWVCNVDKVPKGERSKDRARNSVNEIGGRGEQQYQSQIWYFDAATSELTISWLQSYGPYFKNPSLVYNEGALTWTGDVEAFANQYSLTDTIELKALFEPAQ